MTKVFFVPLLLVMLGWYGCTAENIGQRSDGIGVFFDGAPLVVDSAVVYMGTAVGQIINSEWKNGITRFAIALNKDSQDLKRANIAAVVQNGQLKLVPISGVGEPLPSPAAILGFKNNLELKWFKFKNLIDNINMAASRQAQWLSALSGLSG